jgi:uncharacterized tellurite resistance protein B-like protein
MPMLDGLRQFIADIVSPSADQERAFDDTGYRLAATALLVHVVSLDGEPTEVEKRKLHSLIESSFKLDPGTADRLIASATKVEGEAVDLYHFTSVIMRSVNESGQRIRGQCRLACRGSARRFLTRPDRSQAPCGGAAIGRAQGHFDVCGRGNVRHRGARWSIEHNETLMCAATAR